MKLEISPSLPSENKSSSSLTQKANKGYHKEAALCNAFSRKYKYRQNARVLDEELLTKHKDFQIYILSLIYTGAVKSIEKINFE